MEIPSYLLILKMAAATHEVMKFKVFKRRNFDGSSIQLLEYLPCGKT